MATGELLRIELIFTLPRIERRPVMVLGGWVWGKGEMRRSKRVNGRNNFPFPLAVVIEYQLGVVVVGGNGNEKSDQRNRRRFD